MRKGILIFLVCAGTVVLLPRSGRAVVEVKSKLSDFYARARFVATGKISGVNGNVVEADSVEVLKGVPPRVAGIKLKFDQPAELAARLKPGDPVAVFEADKCLVHVGDTWLIARAAARGPNPAFVTQGLHDVGELFPGRTAGLVAALAELKSGKSTLLNAFKQDIFSGGVKEIGKTLPNAAFAVAADVNGDGKQDLLVGDGAKGQLLLGGGEGLKDATAQYRLADLPGNRGAAGDFNGDGKIDLLVGDHLLVNDGGKFQRQGPLDLRPDAAAVLTAIADLDGDGKNDAVSLSDAGAVHAVLNVGGKAAKQIGPGQVWPEGTPAVGAAVSADFGDDGKPAVLALHRTGLARYPLTGPPEASADAQRLTGRELPKPGTPREGVCVLPLDVNGDGRLDLLTLTEDAGDLYVNRGFGTFLVDEGAGKLLRSRGQQKVPFELKPGTRLVAADLHADKFDDLVVITPEGTIYVLDNPPREAKP